MFDLVCENPYRHTPGPAYIPNLTRSAAPAHALPIGKSPFADKVPTGKHWAPGVAYSAEDIAAITNLSKRMGFAGNVLGSAVGIYDVFVDHKPFVDTAATSAGGFGGGIAGAELGASVGALAGPVGAFVGALAFGVVGSVSGEKVMENLLELARN